jgi:tRNA A37 threonylcarbamoyladenosine synthetase subunit TsaC/SUA5/YrdC
VREALDSQVDVIIDDGYCPPEPTTVIDLSGDSVEIIQYNRVFWEVVNP